MSERDLSRADTRMAAEFLLVRMGQDQKTAAEFIDTVLDNPKVRAPPASSPACSM